MSAWSFYSDPRCLLQIGVENNADSNSNTDERKPEYNERRVQELLDRLKTAALLSGLISHKSVILMYILSKAHSLYNTITPGSMRYQTIYM